MNGLEKLTEYIKSETKAECEDITRKAAEECERIRAEYAKAEQDEYWNTINIGTKEAERRMERLSTLAEMEANKQVLATQQEMIAEAFDLAAKKLLELPEKEYSALLAKLNMKAGTNASDVVAKYKNELSPRVASVLFK